MSRRPACDADAQARRRWASGIIGRHPSPPRYGSTAWAQLPEGDPGRIAAVVVAAEAWATDGDELEQQLQAEVEQLYAAHLAAEDAEYVARRDEHARRWKNGAFQHDAASRRQLAAEIEDEWVRWVQPGELI